MVELHHNVIDLTRFCLVLLAHSLLQLLQRVLPHLLEERKGLLLFLERVLLGQFLCFLQQA